MIYGVPSPRSSSLNGLLASGAAGGVIFIAVFVLLGAISPGYSFIRNTISGLEFTAVGSSQRANFIVFGALLACFSLGLRVEFQSGRGSLLIPLFQFLSACAVFGDGIYIHEPLHMVCDLIAFNSTLVVLFLFAWRFWGDPRWKGWSAYSIVTALLMMGFLAAFGMSNGVGGPSGAFERLAVVTRTTWSVLLASKLLRGTRLGPLSRPISALG
jgi:hypothetical membrane protein